MEEDLIRRYVHYQYVHYQEEGEKKRARQRSGYDYFREIAAPFQGSPFGLKKATSFGGGLLLLG